MFGINYIPDCFLLESSQVSNVYSYPENTYESISQYIAYEPIHVVDEIGTVYEDTIHPFWVVDLPNDEILINLRAIIELAPNGLEWFKMHYFHPFYMEGYMHLVNEYIREPP